MKHELNNRADSVCVRVQPCPQRECIRHCSCQLWTVSRTGLCLCAGSSTVSCCRGSRASTPARWWRGAWTRWGRSLVCLVLGRLADSEATRVRVAGLQVCPESDWLWRAGPRFQRRSESQNTDCAHLCSILPGFTLLYSQLPSPPVLFFSFVTEMMTLCRLSINNFLTLPGKMTFLSVNCATWIISSKFSQIWPLAHSKHWRH